jgi:hypothetical protein
MISRSCINVFSLLVAFALGAMLTGRPTAVTAQPAPQRKCVGIATFFAPDGFTRVYRAFEDGTVEAFQERPDRPAMSKWEPVGK